MLKELCKPILCCVIAGMALSACQKEAENTTPVDPDILAQLNSDTASLTIREEPPRLTLRHDEILKLEIPLAGFQVGAVPEVDSSVNYDPFNIWSPVASTRPLGLTWLSPSDWVIEEAETGLNVTLVYGDAFDLKMRIVIDADRRFKLTLEGSENPALAYIRIVKTVDETEGFYGLGEVFDDVNHRGKVRAMQLELDTRIESANNEAHVPIPFLIGSSGWGIFYHSFYPSAFGVANESEDRVDFAVGLGASFTEGLEFYIFAEAQPLDLTKHYYDVTGEIKLPADWAYGPWVWRDENRDQAQVINDLETLRELDLATSGYWIDRPYASGVNSFDFKPEQFPDPESMVSTMHNLGFRFALWHCTYVGEDQEATAALHATAVERNYYPPKTAPIVNPWGRPIDLTNPEAYAWWQENLLYYTNLGVEGYKLDYVEDFVIGVSKTRFEWAFADGSTERTMHKYYQFLFHKVYAELLPETGGFLLGRSATIGGQTNGVIIWPGDLDANFAQFRDEMVQRDGRSYIAVGGLPAAVVAGLSLGPSGFPFFGSDTGGYRHAPTYKEVFTRWFQHTALSSVMQIGTNANDVAWEFKEENNFDEEMLDWYRIYTRLHLRLFPYAWTYAEQIPATGRAITRPYGLQYPNLNLHPSDVYFFGDDLLVAPVIVEGARDKSVPFPPGQWFDWWDGTPYEGETVQTVAAPLDTLPLYLRAGGIVPMLRPTIDTLSPVGAGTDVDSYTSDPGGLWVRMAFGPDHEFVLFDGSQIKHSSVESAWRIELLPGDKFDAAWTLEIVGWDVENTVISIDGETIPISETFDVDGSDASWAVEGHLLKIRIPAGQHLLELMP